MGTEVSTLSVLMLGSPILDIDATFLIYLAVFAVIFFMLRALVFRPTMALLDAREEAIDGAKRQARDLEKTAEDKIRRFQDEMQKMRTEANTERDRLRAEGSRLERNLIDRVREETEGMVRDAEKKIGDESAVIREKIHADAPRLAGEIAEKLLGRGVDR